ncbi:MAG: prepilin-type N-terminal cleavage/methylation domain-containing protein [Desulfosarcina sp.]|nr:prepilin-type N-terminal cleavage/methylation domain-containing protein [Desulfosarcina sp.]MBC2741945.1 prepilin-type N-terminal cleavage/methylation domain-containing protein [Desulfosarcina sp.]MBC2764858.1 prepilin-type N-terminal cleavage/methylation domain-containing protein [Desulfosarcina sp.]
MVHCGETNRSSGFTPLEVLLVLIIIGIISVIVIGRSTIGQTDLLAQTEVIKSHIRYAQSRAMNSDRSWGIRCDASAQFYWLFVDGDPVNKKRKLPGEESDTVNLIKYKLTLTPTTLSFDDRGRPCSGNDGTTPRANDLSLILSADSGSTTTITITRNTGFVP